VKPSTNCISQVTAADAAAAASTKARAGCAWQSCTLLATSMALRGAGADSAQAITARAHEYACSTLLQAGWCVSGSWLPGPLFKPPYQCHDGCASAGCRLLKLKCNGYIVRTSGTCTRSTGRVLLLSLLLLLLQSSCSHTGLTQIAFCTHQMSSRSGSARMRST